MKFSSKVMTLNGDEVPYLTYDRFSTLPFLRHAFSTRLGGVSQGEFTSMNLSFGRGDSNDNVIENYKRICNAVGFEFDSLVASAQVHEDIVRRVTVDDRGIGITRPRDMQSVDALITDCKNLTLVTYYADCTPIFYVDKLGRAIGLAHAGWRGTVKDITGKVVDALSLEYGVSPSDLLCAVGPVIGKCCYEVDSDCAKQFLSVFGENTTVVTKSKKAGKFYVDLALANQLLLMRHGVPVDNIIVSDLCTRCNSDLLWSHRATNGKRGTMSAFLELK